MRSRRSISGVTLVELMVTSIIMVMVLGASISMYVMGAANWARGESAINVEANSRQGVRRVCNELREAYYVSIDADGMGLTYRKPVKDAQGYFTLPITWDGFDRRIYYTNGKLMMSDGVKPAWTVARNIVTKDPYISLGSAQNRNVDLDTSNTYDSTLTGTSYKIFTPGAGTVTRSVIVKLVTRNPGGLRIMVYGRNREMIFLRNIPQVAK